MAVTTLNYLLHTV